MPKFAFIALFLAACALSPAKQHHALTGAFCDHTQNVYPCGPDVACNPSCDLGETCDVTDTCGPVCGNGDTVCSSCEVCVSGDCLPACLFADGGC